MKSVLLTPLVLLLVIIAVHARHRAAQTDDIDLSSDYNDDSTRERVLKHREHSVEQLKNRRRRWQSSYGYDYPPPHYPDYSHARYENRQDNLLPKILNLLDEIASYVKQPPPPPPPPHPIYVPYPVPYPVFQNCNCKQSTTICPNITNRWPAMDDSRQNWGFDTSDNLDIKSDDADYVDDSIRPVGFGLNTLNQSKNQNTQTVLGSPSQAESSVSPQISRAASSRRRTTNIKQNLTGACDAATLSCCKPSDALQSQADCFNNFGCSNVFRKGEACSPKSIRDVIDKYTQAYARL